MSFEYECEDENVKQTVFELVPEGKYFVQIDDVEDRVSKKGDPMVHVRFKIEDGKHKNRYLWTNVTFIPLGRPGAGMAVHFLKTIGEPFEGKIEVDSGNWIGKTLFVTVVHESWQGKDREAVRDVEPDAHNSEKFKKLQAASDKALGDVPF